jgi:hypothetical protein
VAVVVIATVLSAIGGFLWAAIAASPPPALDVDIGHYLRNAVVFGSVLQVAVWFGWVGMTWFYLRNIYLLRGVQFLPLVRTMGFAFAPMAIQILLLFPVLEFPIAVRRRGDGRRSVLAVPPPAPAQPGAGLDRRLPHFVSSSASSATRTQTCQIFADPNAIPSEPSSAIERRCAPAVDAPCLTQRRFWVDRLHQRRDR